MKKILSGISLILFPLLLMAQPIPEDRLFDWSEAGLFQPISNEDRRINVAAEGADSTGQLPSDDVVTDLIESLDGIPATLYFPAGTYLFNRPLDLASHLTMRGAGADSTTLRFQLNNPGNGIRCVGERKQSEYMLHETAGTGDSMIQLVSDTVSWEPGDVLYILDDDRDLVTSSWAQQTTGQVIRIDSISGASIFLSEQLRRSFRAERAGRVYRIVPVENIRIEHLRIERADQADQQNSNILFRYAINCSVNCIESERCHFAHIDLSFSSNMELTGSYFHASHNYGGGGRGYGVVLQYGSGLSLVSNNVFDSLRHAMLLQAGANGNVLSYNYSKNPHWTSIPDNAAGDLVLHGNYPYANLMEGNIVQNIVIDASHGINGPMNLFFRNRAELYGFLMSPSIPSDSQNIVGNEITNDGLLLGNYVLAGSGHFEYGNNQNGTVRPPGTEGLQTGSLYLNTVPEWYEEHSSWPPIGLPNELNAFTIPAKKRDLSGYKTACEEHDPTDSKDPISDKDLIEVYPNPVDDHLHFKRTTEISELTIFRLDGSVQYRGEVPSVLMVDHWPNGMYLIQSVYNGAIYRKKLMVH